MDIIFSGESSVGKKRSINEDAYFADKEQRLFIVADGMGGHNAGEIASQQALEIFREYFQKGIEDKDTSWIRHIDPGMDDISNVITASVKIANSRVYRMSFTNPQYKGMGTTLAGIYFTERTAYIFNIGDSRVYSYKGGNLLQITEDHSWIQEQVRLKLLTDSQAKNHQWKNVITRALGTAKNINIDLFKHPYESGEIFLICTDGLTSMLDDEKIKSIIENNRLELNEIITKLIDQANKAGGEDNITAISIEII